MARSQWCSKTKTKNCETNLTLALFLSPNHDPLMQHYPLSLPMWSFVNEKKNQWHLIQLTSHINRVSLASRPLNIPSQVGIQKVDPINKDHIFDILVETCLKLPK